MTLWMETVVEECEPTDNRPVLGLPISPFGASKVGGYEKEVESVYDGGEGDATPRALTPSSPQTPRLISPRQLFPPHESPDGPSSDRNPSFSSADLPDFPEPPTASPKFYARRASWSSSLPPSSPTPEHRSRVSLDAPRPLLMPPAVLRSPSMQSRLLTDDEQTTEEGSLGASPTGSLATRRTTRSGSPPMTRYGDYIAPSAPSASLNFTYITDPPSKRHSVQFVNEDLRSAPGVIGLGEGWSGGPQPLNRPTGWFASKPQSSTSDPLVLWGMEAEEEDVQYLDSQRRSAASPLTQIWNRSLRSLMIAESTPDLDATRSQTPDRGSRRAGTGILKRSSSPSRALSPRVSPFTLRQPSFTSQSEMDLSARPQSTNSSSTIHSLSPQSRTTNFPPPASISSPARPTSAQAYQLSQQSRSSFARSEGDLHLPLRAKKGGLPPPWRPPSGHAGARRLSTLIVEGEEDRSATVERRTSPSLLRPSSYSSVHMSPSRALSPTLPTAPEEDFDGGDEEYERPQPEMRRVESPLDFYHDNDEHEERGEEAKPGKRSSFISKVKAVFSLRRPSAIKESTTSTPTLKKTTKRPFSSTFSRSKLKLSSPSVPALSQAAQDPPYERARSPWQALQPSRISKRFSAMSGASEVTVRQPSKSETPKAQEEREHRPRPLSVGGWHSIARSNSKSQTRPRQGTTAAAPSSSLSPLPSQISNLASVRLGHNHMGLEDRVVDTQKRGTYGRHLHSSSSSSSAMSMDDLLLGQRSAPRSASMPLGLGNRNSQYPYAPQISDGSGKAGIDARRQPSSSGMTPEQERASVSTGSSHSPVSSHAPVTPAFHDSLELAPLDESYVIFDKAEEAEGESEEERRNGSRFSTASYASYASLDNEGEVQQGRAVKVNNVLAMQKQASVVSFGELMDRHFESFGGAKV
ncbi:hypothetical protein L198_01142 [Cryptococcus wingfieldii CBS 7118]|uniref:Uncharacterized protein n=1 Tax=Cryptococcus wingfieldii CBS 7118 TaxID=1295528 RepID=A0A1E3K403_9TREE|nr:hypothetical protein L198_01142 [Cryptococcus wingfieldii CBS 7118]ODO07563.1 hypothetical protein L198_01142 [Cryptococcus wingfieldii CBS 7118]